MPFGRRRRTVPRSGARLLVHAALEVTVAQGVFLEVTVGGGHGVATEQLQILEDQLPSRPRSDRLGGRLRPQFGGAGEDGVDYDMVSPFTGLSLLDEHGARASAATRMAVGFAAVALLPNASSSPAFMARLMGQTGRRPGQAVGAVEANRQPGSAR